jgi:hypothetical protein
LLRTIWSSIYNWLKRYTSRLFTSSLLFSSLSHVHALIVSAYIGLITKIIKLSIPIILLSVKMEHLIKIMHRKWKIISNFLQIINIFHYSKINISFSGTKNAYLTMISSYVSVGLERSTISFPVYRYLYEIGLNVKKYALLPIQDKVFSK